MRMESKGSAVKLRRTFECAACNERSKHPACNPAAAVSKLEVGLLHDPGGAVEETITEHAVHHTMIV